MCASRFGEASKQVNPGQRRARIEKRNWDVLLEESIMVAVIICCLPVLVFVIGACFVVLTLKEANRRMLRRH